MVHTAAGEMVMAALGVAPSRVAAEADAKAVIEALHAMSAAQDMIDASAEEESDEGEGVFSASQSSAVSRHTKREHCNEDEDDCSVDADEADDDGRPDDGHTKGASRTALEGVTTSTARHTVARENEVPYTSSLGLRAAEEDADLGQRGWAPMKPRFDVVATLLADAEGDGGLPRVVDGDVTLGLTAPAATPEDATALTAVEVVTIEEGEAVTAIVSSSSKGPAMEVEGEEEDALLHAAPRRRVRRRALPAPTVASAVAARSYPTSVPSLAQGVEVTTTPSSHRHNGAACDLLSLHGAKQLSPRDVSVLEAYLASMDERAPFIFAPLPPRLDAALAAVKTLTAAAAKLGEEDRLAQLRAQAAAALDTLAAAPSAAIASVTSQSKDRVALAGVAAAAAEKAAARVRGSVCAPTLPPLTGAQQRALARLRRAATQGGTVELENDVVAAAVKAALKKLREAVTAAPPAALPPPAPAPAAAVEEAVSAAPAPAPAPAPVFMEISQAEETEAGTATADGGRSEEDEEGGGTTTSSGSDSDSVSSGSGSDLDIELDSAGEAEEGKAEKTAAVPALAPAPAPATAAAAASSADGPSPDPAPAAGLPAPTKPPLKRRGKAAAARSLPSDPAEAAAATAAALDAAVWAPHAEAAGLTADVEVLSAPGGASTRPLAFSTLSASDALALAAAQVDLPVTDSDGAQMSLLVALRLAASTRPPALSKEDERELAHNRDRLTLAFGEGTLDALPLRLQTDDDSSNEDETAEAKASEALNVVGSGCAAPAAIAAVVPLCLYSLPERAVGNIPLSASRALVAASGRHLRVQAPAQALGAGEGGEALAAALQQLRLQLPLSTPAAVAALASVKPLVLPSTAPAASSMQDDEAEEEVETDDDGYPTPVPLAALPLPPIPAPASVATRVTPFYPLDVVLATSITRGLSCLSRPAFAAWPLWSFPSAPRASSSSSSSAAALSLRRSKLQEPQLQAVTKALTETVLGDPRLRFVSLRPLPADVGVVEGEGEAPLLRRRRPAMPAPALPPVPPAAALAAAGAALPLAAPASAPAAAATTGSSGGLVVEAVDAPIAEASSGAARVPVPVATRGRGRGRGRGGGTGRGGAVRGGRGGGRGGSASAAAVAGGVIAAPPRAALAATGASVTTDDGNGEGAAASSSSAAPAAAAAAPVPAPAAVSVGEPYPSVLVALSALSHFELQFHATRWGWSHPYMAKRLGILRPSDLTLWFKASAELQVAPDAPPTSTPGLHRALWVQISIRVDQFLTDLRNRVFLFDQKGGYPPLPWYATPPPPHPFKAAAAARAAKAARAARGKKMTTGGDKIAPFLLAAYSGDGEEDGGNGDGGGAAAAASAPAPPSLPLAFLSSTGLAAAAFAWYREVERLAAVPQVTTAAAASSSGGPAPAPAGVTGPSHPGIALAALLAAGPPPTLGEALAWYRRQPRSRPTTPLVALGLCPPLSLGRLQDAGLLSHSRKAKKGSKALEKAARKAVKTMLSKHKAARTWSAAASALPVDATAGMAAPVQAAAAAAATVSVSALGGSAGSKP